MFVHLLASGVPLQGSDRRITGAEGNETGAVPSDRQVRPREWNSGAGVGQWLLVMPFVRGSGTVAPGVRPWE